MNKEYEDGLLALSADISTDMTNRIKARISYRNTRYAKCWDLREKARSQAETRWLRSGLAPWICFWKAKMVLSELAKLAATVAGTWPSVLGHTR
jgi:hypothetical protein